MTTPDDLDTCPTCGGPADQGHDRCLPPNTYQCLRCDCARQIGEWLTDDQSEHTRIAKRVRVLFDRDGPLRRLWDLADQDSADAEQVRR
jgi:hypothetical protein